MAVLNKYALVYLGILTILLISLVAAEKVDTDLSITVQCTNSTYVNLTYAKYISTSVYLIPSQVAMTKNGAFYNYTVLSINNTHVGTIEYGYKCDINGQEQSFGNSIYVSLMGEDLTSGQGILYIAMIAGLLVVFIITVYGAIIFPWNNPRNDDDEILSINNLKYLKVVLYVFAYLEMLFIVSILKNLAGYLLTEGTYSFFNTIYMFMLIALIPFFPTLIFFTVVIWLNDKKTQKALQRGMSVT